MMQKKTVLALSGSIRKGSTNHRLLQAIAELTAETLDITIYDGLGSLPHFDPDLPDGEEVTAFKRRIREADGVIICTPEYAHGVPGTLKNAIDWTVSSCEFSGKPTALITASTDGRYGHQALLETLKVIEAKGVEQLSLLIPFARTKVDKAAGITDGKTMSAVQELIREFVKTLD